MNPTDFIRKHITAALTAEGFSPSVVQGGVQRGWNITAACRSQPKKGVVLMTVCIVPVSGLLGRQQRQSGKLQRKSREKVVALLPACSDFQHSICFEMTWREIS
ncbi:MULTISPECIES: hypothetical protein [Klebsiella pneumoniae complex]|uniref:hypothetical protein n=1 Tax=Klebsiella pneumoniae complex TaxID=3390273 RepID=UPI00143DB692|nr:MULTISPECIES: hypothetical protein [Klebsiella]MBA6167447.1 hypothetical protein [Klebsiella variicola]MBA6183126.1 hypothetical protein [Klebsiella variicola]MDN4867449.1 hypothetical protein [Klebsiella pneumoniae]MDN4905555.1 hypothetical protein [Klebsiella pneumoniae]